MVVVLSIAMATAMMTIELVAAGDGGGFVDSDGNCDDEDGVGGSW